MNNPFDLSGKVAIITGAPQEWDSRRQTLAGAGAAVVLADYKQDRVKAAERLVAAGHKALGIGSDVSDGGMTAGHLIGCTGQCVAGDGAPGLERQGLKQDGAAALLPQRTRD